MVKIHNLDVVGGIAGRLQSVQGVMIHNTWDNKPALEHAKRLKSYSNAQLMNGYAHYFIDNKDDVRTEQTFNATYHSANYKGNYNYISIEIVGNRSTSKVAFLQAEQNAFYRASIDLKYYGLPVNRSTVRLHCELDVGTYTECPKRSMIEHANYDSTNRQPQWSIDRVKDYYIQEIKKYYNNPKLRPDKEVEKVKEIIYQDTCGLYEALRTDYTYKDKYLKEKSSIQIVKGQRWYFEDIVKTGRYTRAKIRINNDVRYVTMRDDFWKLIRKTGAKKIK